MYRIVIFVALSDGSYRIGWIVYLDRIVSAGLAGLDQLDWIGLDWIGLYRIVSYRLNEETSDFMHWLITARMGRMGRMGRWWD